MRHFISNKIPPVVDSETFSLVYSKSKVNIGDVLKTWESGRRLLAQGKFFEGHNKLAQALKKAYSLSGCNLGNAPMEYFSPSYTVAIGHRANAAMILLGQKLGLLEDKSFILPVNSGLDEEQTKIVFEKYQELQIQKFTKLHTFLNDPLCWSAVRLLEVVNNGKDIIPMEVFNESVFKLLLTKDRNSYLSLSEKYLEYAASKLSQIGLEISEPFVTINLRDVNWDDDARELKVKNYTLAVEELIKRGFKVVQVGASDQTKVSNNKELLQIQGPNSDFNFLTPYLLSKSVFFMSGGSGTAYMAAALGTPVLQTNVIELAKNTASFNNQSFHLPKTLLFNSNKISFSKIISSNVGYACPSKKLLSKQGYTLIENSAEEIRDAVLDILESIQFNPIQLQSQNCIDDIRHQQKSPVFGKISPSYLSENESWFCE